jgi:hypothetical protein
MHVDRSLTEILQMLGVKLFEKMPVFTALSAAPMT